MTTPATGPSQIPILTLSFKAGATLATKQFYFVKLNANRQVIVCAATTDKPIGILQNSPASDEEAEVMVIGQSKISADATLAVNDRVMTSADGQGAVAVSSGYAVGQVIQGAAAGEIAEVVISCANPTLLA